MQPSAQALGYREKWLSPNGAKDGFLCTIASAFFMRPRFEADVQSLSGTDNNSQLLAPETYDASNEQFAAGASQNGRPRFIVEESSDLQGPDSEDLVAGGSIDAVTDQSAAVGVPSEGVRVSSTDPAAWRQEITSRLNSYRARRRPRAPRYPSLQLKFSSPDLPASSCTTTYKASALPDTQPLNVQEVPTTPAPRPVPLLPAADTTAKIIEFPRSAAVPEPLDELAEPVLDRPRILEAPEPTPPPPALGGIMIEPLPQPINDRRPGFEIPLQGAPMKRRMAAGGIDAAVVLSVFVGSAYLFSRLAAVPPLYQALSTSAVFIWLSWSLYQYLMLVYTGCTPGLKLMKLQLRKFDDSPVSRRLRRWRVLASILSGVSLGLGYAWCFLDEDQLCWHDRITHTYMAPKGES